MGENKGDDRKQVGVRIDTESRWLVRNGEGYTCEFIPRAARRTAAVQRRDGGDRHIAGRRALRPQRCFPKGKRKTEW